MLIIHDSEFGPIQIVSSALARHLSLKLMSDRSLRITSRRNLSPEAAHFFIDCHRSDIRRLLTKLPAKRLYQVGDRIGQCCIIKTEVAPKTKALLRNNYLVVQLAANDSITEPAVQDLIRPLIIQALRRQARHHLTQRLSYLARQHHFTYQRLRLTHASTRWGSCSSQGNISLNIALMNLPFELIDYVIIHELCHTRQLNHSTQFWQEVAAILPNYQRLRRHLKDFSPII